MYIRQLPFDVDTQQVARLAPTKTIAEQSKKRHQLPAQRRDLFERHPDDPP
jgi:hypothetical protein